jgi:hypothetical protein
VVGAPNFPSLAELFGTVCVEAAPGKFGSRAGPDVVGRKAGMPGMGCAPGGVANEISWCGNLGSALNGEVGDALRT